MVMQYFISLAVSYGFNHVTQDAFITQPIPNYKIINYFKFSFVSSQILFLTKFIEMYVSGTIKGVP